MTHLVAKVTEWKSPEKARFLCWNVHQLWDNDEVTVNHCVEDEEWGSSEESEERVHKEDYPAGFFDGVARCHQPSGLDARGALVRRCLR